MVALLPLACEAALLALALATSGRVYPGLAPRLLFPNVPSRASSRTRPVVLESTCAGFGRVDRLLLGFQRPTSFRPFVTSSRI